LKRRAFTLIEVIAVVVLIGLLAGATAWLLAEDARSGTRAEVASRISHADRSARLAGMRMGRPCVLRFDLGRNRLRRVFRDSEGREQSSHSVTLPDGYRIDRIVTVRPVSSRGSVTSDSGVVEIPYSTGGRSVSYAVRLSSQGGAWWMVVSGLTGHVTANQNEQDVYKLFSALSA